MKFAGKKNIVYESLTQLENPNKKKS